MQPKQDYKRIKSLASTEEESSTEVAFGSITVAAIDLNAWQHGQELDLGFLSPLQEAISNFFMPNSLWIRHEMTETMNALRQNSLKFIRQVLIGSPGVGKSVLFFLYSLVFATDNPRRKVMYWRKAGANPKEISLLCMEALPDNQVQIRWNKVSIPFQAKIQDIYTDWMQAAYPTFFQGASASNRILFTGHVTKLLNDTVTMFVDGPKQKDDKDTLGGSVDFLCTSGGHTRPANDQNTVLELQVLCGWKKDPFLDCIRHYSSMRPERVEAIWKEHIDSDNDDTEEQAISNADKERDVAELIYYYTGGRIRDGLKLLEGTLSFHKFRTDATAFIGSLPAGAVDLAATSKYGTKDPNSCDTLRTYFEIKNERQGDRHVQIVDSEYYLGLLSDRDMAEKYLGAYKEAVKFKDMAVAGQQFERMMHKVFMKMAIENTTVPFDGHIQAHGNTKEGVAQIRQNKYWMPSVPNFPGIDAAVWTDDGIFNLQYFAGKRHGFKVRAFRNTFLNHIPGNAGRAASTDGKCFITYVVPSDQNQKPDAIPEYHWRMVQINVESFETVMESALIVFEPGVPFERATQG